MQNRSATPQSRCSLTSYHLSVALDELDAKKLAAPILKPGVTFELAGWRGAGLMRSFDEGDLRFSDSLPGQRWSQLLRSAFQIDVILVVQWQMDICKMLIFLPLRMPIYKISVKEAR